MFDGFDSGHHTVGTNTVFARTSGDGPPVLLIHGYPQTHVTWHRVAPALARDFTVIAPDLRGYGDSGAPPDDTGRVAYSKRAMAEELVGLMRMLGFDRFSVVGHDRGARVAYRMALDHPDSVSVVCSLDVVPTGEMWSGLDKDRALGAFHWQFLAQPAPFPETMIAQDPTFFLEWLLESWAAPGFRFDERAVAEYRRCFAKPEVIAATCADYRAGATIDAEHDEQDKAEGRKIVCDLLCLWGAARGFGDGAGRSPTDVWRDWVAGSVSGRAIDCGHFLPEEAPDGVLEELVPFLLTRAG